MGKFRFKKINSKVNSIIKNINNSIKKDDLWLGRFYLHQVEKQIYFYEDHSGICISYLIEVCDKKTGLTRRKWFDQYDFGVHMNRKYGGWQVWKFVNDFIINDVDVWRLENPRDPLFPIDYTKSPMLEDSQKIFIGWV